MTARHRAVRFLLGTFLVYALLVATHLGEFWPFSIYPMFSQGANPWARAVVRELPPDADFAWRPHIAAELPGDPFPLLPNGIDPIDLANFVSKTKQWHGERVAGLRHMFYDQVDEKRLLVVRVDGRIDETDTVRVLFTPYALIGPDTTALNPALPR